MKKLVTICLIFLLLFLGWIGGCKKNVTEPEAEPQPESGIVTVGSTGSGTVTTKSGHTISVIPGSVPATQAGGIANVTFSIESPVIPPKPLSAGATGVSDVIRVGPEGFSFRWPIKITIPFKNADASEVRLLYFDAGQDRWRVTPASAIDNTRKIISVDVMTLGYFAAAKLSQSFSKGTDSDADGGFEFTSESGWYYTLTVKSVTNFKYAYQASWYGTSLVGSSGASGSSPTGTPLQPTHIHLPQATYEIWVSRTKPGTLSELPKLYTYTLPGTGTISQSVTYSTLSTGSGWSSLSLPGGGSWREGSPINWPAPTSTYGTGEFQATLTWINSNSKHTDLDLHLYGPNNIHVFFGAERTSDGTLELDRDWMEEIGNAVENIYSLKKMPSGTYTVRVNLYSGNPNGYSVRIVRFGGVKTYTGSLSTVNDSNSLDKMVIIETFTVQ
ncbi:MAG: hypothetical protein V1799_21805 [bacterium]